MGIAKNREQLIGTLVNMCYGKMDRHYPKGKNPVYFNEFNWTRLRMKDKNLAAHLLYISNCSLVAHLFIRCENRK